MSTLRFCAYQYQHLPLDELRLRWREAEELGFDVLWNCDTVVEPDRPRHSMFDGPTTLTLMATETQRIRVGTLVSSLYFRHPVTLAKAAMTVDHLSGGRVEVALGVGDPTAGGATAGVTWSPGERVARFVEFVELVDLLLRQEVTTYGGRYYQCQEAETIPLPVQRPRPPITIAAHGPKMLRIAAQLADSWSSFGGYEVVTEQTSTGSQTSGAGGSTTSPRDSAATRSRSGTHSSASHRSLRGGRSGTSRTWSAGSKRWASTSSSSTGRARGPMTSPTRRCSARWRVM